MGAVDVRNQRDKVARRRRIPRHGSPKRALLVAYHYPPCQESSGYLRSLAFSRYLPEFGWNPLVLTASVRSYSKADVRRCELIPDSVPVTRAFALDARKHLSIRHKYPALLSAPDRWSSWWLGAVPAGLSLIRRYRPEIIWATQPNPTAFWVAHSLHRLTGIPWVADFRDPIAEPKDNRWANRVCRWIERKTVYGCSRAVFTAPGAAKIHAERYPDLPADRWAVIRNGYDEPNFAGLNGTTSFRSQRNSPLRLLHSGALYPEGRDPRAFFEAIRKLKKSGAIAGGGLEVVLRAPGHETYYLELIEDAAIGDIVRLEPAVPYEEALAEICGADGLLVLQGSMHNGQIPTKIYEYMRVRRPILALTDPQGDTAQTLKDAGVDSIFPIDDSDAIAAGLKSFINAVRTGTATIASDAAIAAHDRKAGARTLSELFNEITTAETASAAGGSNV